MTTTRTIGALTLALLVSAGLASAQTTTGTAASAATTVNTTNSRMTHVNVAILSGAYNPHNVVVPAGSTVVWTNGDSIAHSIVADKGAFSSGSIPSGGTYSQLFADPGTYLYYDPAYGEAGGQGMFGIIVVLPKTSMNTSGTVSSTNSTTSTTGTNTSTTTGTPGVPNTGAGGDAATTAGILVLSGMLAAGGMFILRQRA